MDFVRSNSIRINLYGEIVDLKKPNYGAVTAMQKQFDAAKSSDDKGAQIKITNDFLVSCGLKIEQIEDMEFDHVVQLVELLITEKKS